MKPGELRKQVAAALKAGLVERGFTAPARDDPFTRDIEGDVALRARLFATVDVDRYGDVRITGLGEVVCPWVEDLLDSVPMGALSRAQEVNAGGVSFAVARRTFDGMDDAEHRSPLTWRAASPEQGEEAVGLFLAFVDGPFARWLAAHSDPAGLRAEVDPGGPRADDGAVVRAVSLLDVLLGDAARGRDRLEAYAQNPQRHDTAERVEAFLRWLADVQPRPR